MIRHLHSARKSPFSRKNIAVYAQQYCLQPADRIKEPIFQTGFSSHHSIYLGVDPYGQEWIAENHKTYGVRLVKADEFFKAGRTYTVQRFSGSYREREVAVKRALTLLGRPYDLVSYNCEHYASYVQTGNPISYQVETVMDGLKFVGIAALFVGFVQFLSND